MSKLFRPSPIPKQFSKFGHNWTSSNYGAPGSSGSNTGVFVPTNVALSASSVVLSLSQTQLSPGVYHSSGAEIVTQELFGFGTFSFIMRVNPVVSGTIMAGFLYVNDSQTEIDVEQQGNLPGRFDLTNWTTTAAQQTSAVSGFDSSVNHNFEIIWTPTSIEWWIDGNLVDTHTQNIPSAPSHFIFNLWGTNSPDWGGMATPNMKRTMTISGFVYLAS